MKKVLVAVGIVVLLAVLAVATLPLWISPVATNVVRTALPKSLGVDASLEGVSLNPFTGTLSLNGLRIENPKGKGFSSEPLFKVEKMLVSVSLPSLARDVVEVRRIEIAAPVVRCEMGAEGNNLAFLLGEKKSSPKPAQVAAKPVPAPTTPPPKPVERKQSKRITIDEVSVTGIRAELASPLMPGAALPIDIQPVVLHDLGKESGGIGVEDAARGIFREVATKAKQQTLGKKPSKLGALGALLGGKKGN